MLKYSLILLAGVAAPAFAQTSTAAPNTTADPGNDGFCLCDGVKIPKDIVVTASGVPQPAEQIGQAVTVIGRAEIERRQTVVLSDLLATTPGVTVSRNGGPGTLTAVRIRGAEGEQTLTLIDGVRVNDPSSPGGAFDFASLLAGSIDRVEVLRGPNSVPWGSQAIGGVVNVVTLQPTDRPAARGNIEYGEHNSLFANAGLSGKSGIFSGALTGGYLRSDGISAAASGAEPDGYRQYGATGRVGVEFTPGIGLDLRGYYADSRVDLDGFQSAPPFAPADDAEFARTRELYGYAGAHANFAGDTIRNRIAFTVADIHRDNFDPGAGPAPIFFAQGHDERYEYQGDFQVVKQVRLVAGAEHEDSRFFDGTSRPTTGITSFYGEAILTPVKQLTITGGIRHDQHRRFGGHISVDANAALALGEGTTLRASYAEGFKAPTLFQLFAPFFGTPTLQPETARNFDAGISQSFAHGRVTASATYFHRDTRNQIDFDNSTFTYNNIVRARAEGVELELAVRPVEDLTLSANYSYIDSENRSPGANFGKDLARRPRSSASLSGDYRLPFGLLVGSTVSHVSHSFDNAANTVRLGDYTLVGIRAEMPVGKTFSIYGRVENLFDEKYQTVAGYGTDRRAVYGGVRVKIG
jgi:vitamin B12 transporter